MTSTEKILNMLEINPQIPCLVVDELDNITAINNAWSDKYGLPGLGKSIYKIFDKSSASLIKNSLIDAKTFDKIQRRQITFETDESIIERKLLISPFRLESKHYFYILIYSDLVLKNEFLVYPSSDDHNIKSKYAEIFEKIENDLASTDADRNNIKHMLESASEPVAVVEQSRIISANRAFARFYNVDEESSGKISLKDVFADRLNEKIALAENELLLNSNIFVIEKIDYSPSSLTSFGRITLYPLIDKNEKVYAFVILGKISIEQEEETISKQVHSERTVNIDGSDAGRQKKLSSEFPQVVYDKNNFEILEVNGQAVEFYGYDEDNFKEMNMTQLFPPEDMQKLLVLPDKDEKVAVNQKLYDGSLAEPEIYVENIYWEGREAYLATLFSQQQFEEEVIPIDESELQDEAKEAVSPDLSQEQENTSDFLSNLFHEILTPVNVILGFVQEIIDSIDIPTEEQSESAQIIKDNQQLLLQTMNTSVQYAKLVEGSVKLSPNEFDFYSALTDLQDNISQYSDKSGINIIIDEIEDSLILYHDRSKLLIAISYFIKFLVKMTDSSRIHISFKNENNEFFVIVSENENGISENLFSSLLRIFNPAEDYKNDHGISLISIKLARKLNELLQIKIREYINPANVKQIALTTPLKIDKSHLPGIKSPLTEIEDKVQIAESESSKDSEPESAAEELSSEVRKDRIGREEIKNGDVDDRILEDIEEEKEIVTEEIASTVGEVESDLEISNYSCLFIDDNVDTRLLFESQMNDFKFLKVCSNLTEALPLLRKYSFDIIFIDINLNDSFNGLDALKIIRQLDSYSSVPLIAITAYSFDGAKQKFIDFGFSDYLVKPLLRDRIVKSLESVLR